MFNMADFLKDLMLNKIQACIDDTDLILILIVPIRLVVNDS